MNSINLPQHIRIHMGTPTDSSPTTTQPGIDIDMPDNQTVVNINIGNAAPNQPTDKKQVNINLPSEDTFQRNADQAQASQGGSQQAGGEGGQDFFQQGANQSNALNSYAGLAPQQQTSQVASSAPLAQNPSASSGAGGDSFSLNQPFNTNPSQAVVPQAYPNAQSQPNSIATPSGTPETTPQNDASRVAGTPSGTDSKTVSPESYWYTPTQEDANSQQNPLAQQQPPLAPQQPQPAGGDTTAMASIPQYPTQYTTQGGITPDTKRYTPNSSVSNNAVTPENPYNLKGFTPSQPGFLARENTVTKQTSSQTTSTNNASGGFNPTAEQPQPSAGNALQSSSISQQAAQGQDAMKQQLLNAYNIVQNDYDTLNAAYQQFEAAKSQYIQHNAQYESLGSTLNDMAYNHFALSNSPYASAYPGSVPMAGMPQPQAQPTPFVIPQQGLVQDTFTPGQPGQPSPQQALQQPPAGYVTLQQPGLANTPGGQQAPPPAITQQDVSNLRQMMMTMSPETAQMVQTVSDNELAQMLNSDPEMIAKVKQLGSVMPQQPTGVAPGNSPNAAPEQAMQTPTSPAKALEIAMQNPQALAQAQALVNSLSPQERQKLQQQLANDPQAQAALAQMGLSFPQPSPPAAGNASGMPKAS